MEENYQGKKLILIDGHSIINRAFYGMPDLTNSRGVHTGAVYGFLNILFRILDEEKAQYLIVAFDEHAPTFRHEMFDAYKGTRKPMPEELRSQVPLLREVLTAMGITIYSKPGIEADDILGSYARLAEGYGMEVTLVSGDRDLLQIASDKTMIRLPKTVRGQTTIENYHAEDVFVRYHLTPEQVIEIKGLMGDSSDNIPGVPGVGEKTAHQLIDAYGSVDGVYEHIDEITKKALHQHLVDGKESAYLSKKLATIKTDCDVPADLSRAAIGNFYTPEAYRYFTDLNFRAYLRRFDDAAVQAPASEEPTQSTSEDTLEWKTVIPDGYYENEDAFAVIKNSMIVRMEQGKASGADSVTVSVFPLTDSDQLLQLAVAIPGRMYLFTPSDTPAKKGELATDKAYLCGKLGDIRRLAAGGKGAPVLVCFDMKKLYPFLDVEPGKDLREDGSICLDGCFDTLLGSYLHNPLKSDYMPEDVVTEYLPGTIPPAWVQQFDKKTPAEAFAEDPEKTGKYCTEMARLLLAAAPKIAATLRDEGMWDLYRKVELPLSYILYDMQKIGILVHPEKLTEYSEELGRLQADLEQKIYAETGTEFNIGSPKQLGEVLFDKMGIKGGKKTKTGYSTAADVLEKLAPDYPVIGDILSYRAVSKLKSTYADGLTEYIASDSRIHTCFNQTITATGRISSSDPNLQNIPMRTEMGRRIRKAFFPRDGWSFTDSDYSQIELRILASMSGDEELIEAYRENKDIHRITASKVFHVPFDEVTPLQRRNAKAVNFGIVYGISSFGLANNIDISRKEAQQYIDEYFKTYPGIKAYLDGAVKDAKERGYSVTLFGRRRPIPELASSNFMTRQFGERVAMNAPIQGTAADIMKIGMIRVWERLHREMVETVATAPDVETTNVTASAGADSSVLPDVSGTPGPHHLRSQLILQIHDELLIETAPGEEEIVATILREEMKAAADLPVSLETDVHSGSDWYEAK